MNSWRHCLYLGWRYTRGHPARSLTLVASLALLLWLPAATRHLVGAFADSMLARSRSTPLLAGARGSRFDLALHSLYFRGRAPAGVSWGEVLKLGADGLAEVVPLHVRFTARRRPLVGTTLEYFFHRGLEIAQGEPLLLLGDCVVGARVARELGLKPGDRITTDPENVFDLAGSYPLNLLVRGTLAPSHTADDDAVFVDLKTAWIVEGIGHGHDAVTPATDARLLLKRADGTLAANSALRHFTEITPANAATFHFHGDPGRYPVTSALLFPRDDKSAVLLEARLAPRDPLQIVRPEAIVGEMLGFVFEIRRFLELNFALVGMAMLGLFVLILSLAMRLRKAEFETLTQLGCSRSFIARLVGTEVLLMTAAAAAVALVMVVATRHAVADWLLRIVTL